MHRAAVIGAGGLGREVLTLVQAGFGGDFSEVVFHDDGKPVGSRINGVEVAGKVKDLLGATHPTAVFLAIGLPSIKSAILKQLVDGNGMPRNPQLSFPNLIHLRSSFQNKNFIQMGQGNIIQEGVVLTTDVRLGDFNLLNLHVTLGHDVRVGNGCSLMPGVHVSGGAQIGNEVYIGTGANLIKATTVGNAVTIGAGAMVNVDIPAGETWGGIPAKPLHA